MQALAKFLLDEGFEEQEEEVTVTRTDGCLYATVPCGRYVQEFFADESEEALPLPLAIVKRRRVRILQNGNERAKPKGVLVILPDFTGYYRKGAVDERTRDVLKSYCVKFCGHSHVLEDAAKKTLPR